MKKKRNKEIEVIINKLGDETVDSNRQIERRYEKKIIEIEK